MVIQQNGHKFLMMAILMSETCWAHKKGNNKGSDIKLVFYSSTNIVEKLYPALASAQLSLNIVYENLKYTL